MIGLPIGQSGRQFLPKTGARFDLLGLYSESDGSNTSGYRKAYHDYIKGSLCLTEAIQVSYSNTYKELIPNQDLSKTKMLYAMFTGSDFASLDVFGFQTWAGTSPLSVEVNLKFFLGMWGYHNALVEVYNPLAFLSTLGLSSSNGGVLSSPSPTMWPGLSRYVQSLTLITSAIAGGIVDAIIPNQVLGQSLQGVNDAVVGFVRNTIDAIGGTIVGWLNKIAGQKNAYRGLYTIKYGQIMLTNLYVTDATPTFSQDVQAFVIDNKPHYFPISGSVKLSFKSMFSASAGSIPVMRPSNYSRIGEMSSYIPPRTGAS